MSDFLAEARILVRPDTTRFRAQLQEEVNRAIAQTRVPAVQIPLTIGAAGVASAAAQTAALTAAQAQAQASATSLTTAENLLNTSWGRQAVLLEATTAATLEKAGADAVAARAARAHAATQSQVEKAAFASAAGMAGLRGAVLTAGTAFLAATVGFQAFGRAVSSAADFERQLSVFRVTAGATADEMARVSAQARALGADISLPAVSAQDAAIAMTELAKAGLTVQDSLEGARGVLELATAAQIDNAQAAEFVANALNTFDLAGTEATKVADLLAGASIAAQGSISDMGLAFRQAGAVTEQFGLSINEAVTLITALAKSGLQGSDAGTSLRVALLRLVNPTNQVKDAIATLGLNLQQLQGNLSPEAFAQIGAALRQLPPELRRTTIAILGGQDAVRAFGQLADFSGQELAQLEEEISQAGLASDLAAAQTEGLAGQIEGLKNEAAAAGLTLGQLASPILSGVAASGRGVFRSINLITEGVRAVVQPTRQARSDFADLRQEFIEARDDLQRFRESTDNMVPPALTTRLQEARAALEQFGGAAKVASGDVTVFDAILQGVQGTLDNLAKNLKTFGQKATAGGGATGLNVQQILNRVAGFDEAETQARIRGDTEGLLSVLEQERAFLEEQLTRAAVQNREPLRRQLKDALLGVINDISSIQRDASADAKKAAADAAKAQQDADQALLDLLSNRRDDADRRAAAAATTEGLQDDIRAQDRIQALIKQQIQKVRDRIKDEQARKAAIRELRIAIIDSRAEEEKLREEQKKQAKEAAQQILDIKIQIAQEKGNEALEKRLLKQKKANLKQRIDAAKGDKLLVAQLQLELAQTQSALNDLNEQEDQGQQDRKTAAQFFFEQLQAQQGFAANLLGNLIPRDQTAGLVGVPSPQVQIQAQSQAAQGRALTAPTSGQVSTTNDILRAILRQLQSLNRDSDAPEAINQRRVGSAAMTGGGGNAEVM